MSSPKIEQIGVPPVFQVSGVVRWPDGLPAGATRVVAVDRGLRSEEQLGESQTDGSGAYRIEYSSRQIANRERGAADLIVRALDVDGSVLAASPVLFNAPADAQADVTIPDGRLVLLTLVERVGSVIKTLLGTVSFAELEEDGEHQDVMFLSGATGFDRRLLVRFVLAHRLVRPGLEAEFWFALLGGPLPHVRDEDSVAENLRRSSEALPTLDENSVRRGLARSFAEREIPGDLQGRVDAWVEAFLGLVASAVLGGGRTPTFAKMALVDAGITGATKQAKLARLLHRHRGLTPELLAELAKGRTFKKAEIADLETSYQLGELTGGDFPIVQVLKEEFDVRRPEQVRTLAKRSEAEWIELIQRKQGAGEIALPVGVDEPQAGVRQPTAETYAKALERQFREAFPTAAFSGGLERALGNGGARGIRNAEKLGWLIEEHPDFDLLRTPVDEFLKNGTRKGLRSLGEDEEFRVQLKAVQRVFKLAPTFEAADALLADGLHSAQMVYRQGEGEFVERYGSQAGFTPESAHAAWNRAADTHAAVLTVIADLKSFDDETLPMALRSGTTALSTFPNWETLFQAGDVCDCTHCRSVLSPAAYLTDLLMFLRDRPAADPTVTVKDVLFARRPDLGYLELNCENALTTLPYIDVVCEVLERVVAAGEDDIELVGFGAVPAGTAAAHGAVASALSNNGVHVGAEFTLSQVDPLDPDRWVVHGDDATYLLKKKSSANFFAELVPNTKASSAELRAHPAYVNAQAYGKLRQARFPFALPFDLFGEEVRAGFKKSNVQRWDLMRTFRGPAAPNNPTDGDIAAEYFCIGCDPGAAFDEKRLIVVPAATAAGQKAAWGVSGNGWLTTLANVRTFLGKTGLEYDELLALLDLPFVNPTGDIFIEHLDASCDTAQKVVQGLNATKLDRIHRFLRMWRKLSGWKMWELDLAVRCPGIGGGVLNEPFLVNLFNLSRLRSRLGTRTSIAQLCGLFDSLSTRTHFTEPYEKRADGLYQSVYLKRNADAAFAVDAVDVAGPTVETISGHRPAVAAALGVSETDLDVLAGLTRASDGTAYVTDDLTLTNLSVLWRHAWMARLLRYKAREWKALLTLLQRDVAFDDPLATLTFVQEADALRNTGFSIDELDWLLAADRGAKAAVKEADAARFLTALRTELRAIGDEFDPAQYTFLDPPVDVDRLSSLLLTLLPQLRRDEAQGQFLVDSLRDEIAMRRQVPGLPASFDFPAAIGNVPIRYEPVLRFDGVMTVAQRDTLLAAVTGLQPYEDAIRDLFENPGAAAPVNGLPPNFAFPATITGPPNNLPITYEPTVRFTGYMTTAQKATLLNHPALAAVAPIPDYQEAVEEFFQAPRLVLKFFDVSFSSPLAVLPAAVDFGALADPVLAARVTYDSERRVLRVAGVLSASDKQSLDALSADPDYRAAVDSLFTMPTAGVFPPQALWMQDADLQFPLRDLSDSANDNLATNLATAVTKALAFLTTTSTEHAVVRQAGARLGLSEALTRHLLTAFAILPDTVLDHVTSVLPASVGVVDYATLPGTFDAWFWTTRVAALWRKWNVTLAEVEQTRDLTVAAQLLDPRDVPLNASAPPSPVGPVVRTSRLLTLQKGFPRTDLALLDVLVKLDAGGYPTVADFAADAERVNPQWRTAGLESLVGTLDAAYPAGYLLAETWNRVQRAFELVERLGAGMPTVTAFAAPTMTSADASTLSAILRAKVGDASWLALSSEIQDVLRERKRDALAAYRLAQPEPADAPTGRWETTDDLYAYYLLDVEMSACQLTSRVVQASSSVQHLVQRCFMGLEPAVTVTADGDNRDSAWRWWTWMRKYRVWEANRKVFLYPENWVDPELRRDRSSFFKDLENDLLQDEVNHDTAQAAFACYLERLDGVAQLEIAGFYQEDDDDDTILHVFGRTAGTEPHVYYYRRCDYRQWTAWTKVDLDIQGDYLVPAVANKRLFLLWPDLKEVPDEVENSTVTTPSANTAGVEIQKASKRLRLHMAVSDYQQGKWTPKRVSKDYVDSSTYRDEMVRKHYSCFALDRPDVDGHLTVRVAGFSANAAGFLGAYILADFEISGCRGVPERTQLVGGFDHAVRPEEHSTGVYASFLKWQELGSRADHPANDLTLDNVFTGLAGGPAKVPVLQETPWFFQIAPPWHLSYMDRLLDDGLLAVPPFGGRYRTTPVGTWLPFFYRDKKRTFLVLPALPGRPGTPEGRTGNSYYPDVKREVRKEEGFLETQVRKWVESVDLAKLTPAERQQLEDSLHLEPGPWETVPPFGDAEVRARLAARSLRLGHYQLGLASLRRHQTRHLHFLNFYHPFVCDFATMVHDPLQGLPALMRRETQFMDSGFRFRRSYQPTSVVVDPATDNFYPREVVDFSPGGAYSSYNWELFFHVPLLIANALSRNQRFEEARNWYHAIFNPLGIESPTAGGSVMSKFWITKPFFETTDPQYIGQRIDNVLRMLAGDSTLPGFDPQAKAALEGQVVDWRTNPFDPHRLAGYRTVAYQKAVVMKYLDNLIAWGDSLFRQDTMESINEATQLYVLAADILGPPPKRVPPQVKPPIESFNELERQLDTFANALVEVENLMPLQSGTGTKGAQAAPLPTLYFCIPHNDKMVEYWDTVADRLYKIRHCMNIEGVARQLALFEPPIDPGALVKAVAAGVDVGAAMADLNAPLPLYRFNVLLQKANEVCNDVKSLGGALLSALEKKDGEALSLVRQGQEIRVLEAVTAVRKAQIEEAKENLEGARRSKVTAETRRNYYRDIERLSAQEQLHLAKMATSQTLQEAAQAAKLNASIISMLPQLAMGASGFGGSPHATVALGGVEFGAAANMASEILSLLAQRASSVAAMASSKASFDRRWDDWKLQERLAEREIEQLDRQIAASELRVAIAEKELENHTLQIENAREIEAFMTSKYTNEELYHWHVGQVSGVYLQSYQLTLDLAKRAERCFRFELGVPSTSFVNGAHWDSLRKGLLAGEKLQYDLRRMEIAYLEQNRRELELTKHVSLGQMDPLALVQLRETGRCFFQLPEEVFDLDYPGHYMRRIKTVSLTLPCVTGPYTTVPCTLRLLRNSIRVDTTDGDDGYPRNSDDGLPGDDQRFVENNIPVKAIASSSGQNDSGVFELSFRDERYLPFEGAGVISDWSLELFNDPATNNVDPVNPDFGRPLRQFDYSSITDAVLHIRYTAREDAGPFKNGAVRHLRDHFSAAGTSPSLLLLDLRREFATEWSRFLNPANPAAGNVFDLEMSPACFPIRDAGTTLKVNSVHLLVRSANPAPYNVTLTPPLPTGANAVSLNRDDGYGGLHVGHLDVTSASVEIPPTGPPSTWTLTVVSPASGNPAQEVQDMLLVVGYQRA